jgi:hypothetical protein
MELTINAGEHMSPFEFIEGTVFYKINNNENYHQIHQDVVSTTIPDLPNVLSLVSDQKKVFLHMPHSVYHFFMDFLGKLLYLINQDNGIEVVIDTLSLSRNGPGTHIYDGAISLLQGLGVTVTLVDFSKYNGITINNVFLLSYRRMPADKGYATNVFNAGLSLVKDKNVVPFRKVFLSRRMMGNRPADSKFSWLTVLHDNRIDNHDFIENYFRSLGYEVILPEEFSSLEEQVNFFYETAVLVSTTSSGLTNALFMQEGQTLIELQTPLVVHVPKEVRIATGNPEEDFANYMPESIAVEQLHYFYLGIAFQRGLKYLAINNLTRATKDIKSVIDGDPYLKALLTRSEPVVQVPENKKRKSWLKR